MNYDLSDFHPDCKNKAICPSMDGKIYVWCGDCQVLADVEAVGAKVAPMDACRVGFLDRVVIGKQSLNVHKGGFKP